MIEVEHLSKEFKIGKKYEGFGGSIKTFLSTEYSIKKAVNDLSFHVSKGEMLGYIGLNGAGKSTTIKMLSGIMVPTSGRCVVNGMVPYENRKQYTKNIGVVFGNRSQLWWDLPVSESFSVLQKIYDIPKKQYDERLDFLKHILGLDDFYLMPVRQLSLGQKMRADLAASMIHNPAVLFLDEPTIGLDIMVKERIRTAIKQINNETQTTIVLTTHDLDDIEEICNRIVVIDNGTKIFEGTLEELKNTYSTTRMVSFEFEDKQVDISSKTKEFGVENISIEESGRTLIEYNSKNVDMPHLIHKIVGEYPVKDVVTKEPKLEDIVKKIYKEEE